jgi:uncharacterized membrane protein YgcG
MTRGKTQLLPDLAIDGADYEVPKTEYTHARIVGNATHGEVDASILVPTLRPDYLEYHALTALFSSPRNTSVMVMSSNAGVRRRFKDLGLRGPHLIYSETHWTLASVKAGGDLAQKTELYTNQDGYPQFLYAKYSTRLPKGKDADRVHTVIYDSTVTFDWDRWTEFNEWREDHDIKSVVYFCRDPTSPVADQVLDEVDTTWGWTPSAIADMYDQGQGGVDTSAASDGAGIVPETTLRDQELLQQRAQGVTFDLQILPSGDVAEALSAAWNRHDSLKESAYKIGDDDAITAVKGVERAINGYSRLVADPEYSRNYRVGHGRAKPHDVRIGQLEAVADGLSGDAGAIANSLRKGVRRLEDIRDAVNDEDNLGDWKRGSVLRAIQSIVDDEEHTLHIVAPDEPARKAVRADLQLNRGGLWGRAKSRVNIHSPATLAQAPVADELILYGPPRRGDLWILRTPHAKRLTILAYPHELGLLHYQVRLLNEAIADFTPVEVTDPDMTVPETARPNTALDRSVPSLTSGNESDEDDEEYSPTRQIGPYEGVSLDIPDPEEVVEFDTPEVVSGDEDDDITDSPVDRYTIVGGDSEESLDDLVRDTVGEHRSAVETFGKGGSNGGNGGGGGGGIPPIGGGGGGRSGAHETRRINGLVEAQTDDGYAYAGDPSDTVEVVRMGEGTTVEKKLSDVKSGERVVLVRDYQAVRQAVEDHLMNMGEIDIVVRAHMWHQQLDIELEDSGDSLQEFREKVESAGATASAESTFEGWYTGEVNMPRSKANLRGIVDAYDMEEVADHFNDVWDANWKIRKVKREVVKQLKQQAADALADHDPNEDIVLHDDLDVRLSDFDPTDNQGRALVEQHTIQTVVDDIDRPVSYVGRWRQRTD